MISYEDLCKEIDSLIEILISLEKECEKYFKLLQGNKPSMNGASNIQQDKVQLNNPYLQQETAVRECARIIEAINFIEK